LYGKQRQSITAAANDDDDEMITITMIRVVLMTYADIRIDR